jgi:hypothetical protein
MMDSDGEPDEVDLGPQYPGDSVFAARMRRHQSWYRAAVLKVPHGTGPGPHDTTDYGSYLRKEDGEYGLNFLTPTIFEVAKRRIQQLRGAVEPYRLLCNMLSSQPMCFNLFGPLVDDLDLAIMLLQPLLPGRVDQVLRVEIEFAPEPASEYLADRTAFDAFIEYRRPDGKLGCLGVETKLSEPFSRKRYDGPSYRRWMQSPGSPFCPEAHTMVDDRRHNQLWRDHLLAIAMRDHPCSPYAESSLLLVRHPLDAACERIAAGYRRLLCSKDDTFIDLPLDQLVRRWRDTQLGPAPASWLTEFQRRYLDLTASAHTNQPSRFQFFIGGYMGVSYEVAWNDTGLTYRKLGSGYGAAEDEVEILPSETDWERFWQSIARLGVWNWQKSYEDPHVLDGTHWSLELATDSRSIQANGSNAYPARFEPFLRAVSRLAGGRQIH